MPYMIELSCKDSIKTKIGTGCMLRGEIHFDLRGSPKGEKEKREAIEE